MASRLFTYLCLLPHLDIPLEQATDSSSYPADAPDQQVQPMAETALKLTTDTGALSELLVELVPQLRSLLPHSCQWLEEGAIEVICDRPINAGEVADILVCMIGDQKVAIKHYRFHSSSDYLPAYMVSVFGRLWCPSY